MSEKYNQQEIDEEQQTVQQKPVEDKKQADEEQLEQKQEQKKQIPLQQQQQPQQPLKKQQQPEQKVSSQIHQTPIKHQQIGKYANISMEVQEDKDAEIKLKIVNTEVRSSTFTKFTVYVIKGHDKNGEINVSRRFSEFHAMRTALCKRWPGCFIPSIPQKNYMGKNDKSQVIKRERYLNDFLYKVTKLPHLYNSEQFQTLIKSGSQDISSIFDSWSTLSYQAIINKYRECFSDLAGKKIDQSSNDTIAKFYASVQKNQNLVERYRQSARNLAIAKDRYNRHFPLLISRIIPGYEEVILNEYTNKNESQLVYLNPNEAKMCEHAAIINDISDKNSFWLLYDMLKHEQRDGRAFMEMIKNRESLQSKKHALQVKIKQNEKSIAEIGEGKKNMKSMTSKSSNDELKYKLEMQTQQLKKQKTFLGNLLDIITALIIYVEIPTYRAQKIAFYHNVLKKIGGFQINSVQICGEVWETTSAVAKKIDQSSS